MEACFHQEREGQDCEIQSKNLTHESKIIVVNQKIYCNDFDLTLDINIILTDQNFGLYFCL